MRNSATGPQQHVPPQAMAPMFPRLRFGLPNSLVSEVVARSVSEWARRASHDCRRIAHGYLARFSFRRSGCSLGGIRRTGRDPDGNRLVRAAGGKLLAARLQKVGLADESE